jgi:hypothetical protein
MRNLAATLLAAIVGLSGVLLGGENENLLDKVPDPTLRSMPVLNGAGLEAAVKWSVDRGFNISIIVVTSPRRVIPAMGPDGTGCSAGPDSRDLFRGKYSTPTKVGKRISLFPETSLNRVIVILHSRGNWIEYSKESEEAILSTLKELGAEVVPPDESGESDAKRAAKEKEGSQKAADEDQRPTPPAKDH